MESRCERLLAVENGAKCGVRKLPIIYILHIPADMLAMCLFPSIQAPIHHVYFLISAYAWVYIAEFRTHHAPSAG